MDQGADTQHGEGGVPGGKCGKECPRQGVLYLQPHGPALGSGSSQLRG